MIEDREQARDEIIALVKAAWDTTGNPVLYEGVKADQPGADVSWIRVKVQHNSGGQTGFGQTQKKMTDVGIVFVQIFTPFGDGLSLADQYTKLLVAAFEGKDTPGGVWFRNVGGKEIGEDGPWYNVDVTAEFEYDRII